jgi:hypothetical protein
MPIIRELKLRQFPGAVGAIIQEITRALNEVIRKVNTASEKTRVLVGHWSYANMPASSTLPLFFDAGTSVYSSYVCHRSGSIRGITFGMSTPITAGTLRVQIYHNGASIYESGYLPTTADSSGFLEVEYND